MHVRADIREGRDKSQKVVPFANVERSAQDQSRPSHGLASETHRCEKSSNDSPKNKVL